jgi:hypothetical protein
VQRDFQIVVDAPDWQLEVFGGIRCLDGCSDGGFRAFLLAFLAGCNHLFRGDGCRHHCHGHKQQIRQAVATSGRRSEQSCVCNSTLVGSLRGLDMTQSEFISKLDEMKRRGRGLFAFAFTFVIAINSAGVYWLHFFRVHRNSSKFWVWGVILMGIWLGAVSGILFCFKRHVKCNAPKCPSCDKPLTFRERARVLAGKQCPFCEAQVINELGA